MITISVPFITSQSVDILASWKLTYCVCFVQKRQWKKKIAKITEFGLLTYLPRTQKFARIYKKNIFRVTQFSHFGVCLSLKKKEKRKERATIFIHTFLWQRDEAQTEFFNLSFAYIFKFMERESESLRWFMTVGWWTFQQSLSFFCKSRKMISLSLFFPLFLSLFLSLYLSLFLTLFLCYSLSFSLFLYFCLLLTMFPFLTLPFPSLRVIFIQFLRIRYSILYIIT